MYRIYCHLCYDPISDVVPGLPNGYFAKKNGYGSSWEFHGLDETWHICSECTTRFRQFILGMKWMIGNPNHENHDWKTRDYERFLKDKEGKTKDEKEFKELLLRCLEKYESCKERQ